MRAGTVVMVRVRVAMGGLLCWTVCQFCYHTSILRWDCQPQAHLVSGLEVWLATSSHRVLILPQGRRKDLISLS